MILICLFFSFASFALKCIIILESKRMNCRCNDLITCVCKTACESTWCETTVCCENIPFQIPQIFRGISKQTNQINSVTFVALFCIIVLNIAFLFDCFSVQLKRIPPHCLEGLRGVYSQLEVFTCSKGVSSLEVMFSPTGIGTVTISLTMFIYRKQLCVCLTGASLSMWRRSQLSFTLVRTSYP